MLSMFFHTSLKHLPQKNYNDPNNSYHCFSMFRYSLLFFEKVFVLSILVFYPKMHLITITKLYN